MQLSHSFLTAGIGTLIALGSVGGAVAQPEESPSPLVIRRLRNPATVDSNELAQTEPASEPIEELAEDAGQPLLIEADAIEADTLEAEALEAEVLVDPEQPAIAEGETLGEEPVPAGTAIGDETPDPGVPIDPIPPGGITPGLPTTPAPGVAPIQPAEAAPPEYLNPSPNPLETPTQTNEVEIVGTQPITLEEALELARRNSPEVQQARLQVERAEAVVRAAQADRLPTVSTGANLTAQEAPQRAFPPGNGDDVNITLGGALEVNYDLLTGGRRSAAIRAAEGQLRFQQLQLENQLEQIRLDVTNDYYDLQQADEQVRIAQASLEQALRSLGDAEALERAGVGTRFDVLQAQVDVANTQQELTQRISQQQIARRQLAQRLNIAQQLDVAAADPVEIADLWNLTLEESIVLAYQNRAELTQQLVQREVNEAQRQAALAATRPQVSLFANYNVSTLLNEADDGFSDTYQLGARLGLTLFDGGAARARANQEEVNIAIAESQFEQSRNQVRFQVEQAYSTLQANFNNIQTASLALQQAAEALRLARLRFQAGVGTQTDVLRAQTELTRAEVNQLQAVLGYNRSLATLQRAVSNFPNGTLGATP